jgi:methylmalonyl-CoA/ethylmalonyl-CoA epimerase
LSRIESVDHVAIALHSIEEALPLFVDVFGCEYVAGGDDERLGIRTIQLTLGQTKVELMQPIAEDSYLRRYLERHGPGFHHLTLFVADLRDAVAELEARGFQVVDTDVTPPWRETYIRPRSGFGTLLQVVEVDETYDPTGAKPTLEDAVAGRSIWVDSRPALRPEVAGT